MNSKISIQEKEFSQLTVDELYELLKLRVDVFVVEQACAYEELDNQDQQALHLLLSEQEKLVGYARILFEKGGLHIGRIIVAKSHRKKGFAAQLMEHALAVCEKQHPSESIHLSAQAHLEDYYKKFGFETTSPAPYDWDGILHVDMERK